MRGTSLSSNREDAALSQRRCGFESRRGYVHARRFVACVMVTFGSYLFCTAWAGFGFSSLLPYSGFWSCFAPLAQLVEQRTLNPWVAGSSPAGRTLCGFGMLATHFCFEACRALGLS